MMMKSTVKWFRIAAAFAATAFGMAAHAEGVPQAYTSIVERATINSLDGFAMLKDPTEINPAYTYTDPFTLDITYQFDAFSSNVMAVVHAISPMLTPEGEMEADFKDFTKVQNAVVAAVGNGNVTLEQVQEAEAFLLASRPYWDLNCDFVVKFDHDVKAGSFILGGKYTQASIYGFNGWVCSSHTNDLAAGRCMRLLRDNAYQGAYVTYYEICSRVQQFLCGVKNLSDENVGTKMTVELRIYDKTETYENSLLVGSYEYTFEGAAAVDGKAFMYLEDAIAAWKDGTTLKLLNDGQANLTVPSGESRTLDLNGYVLSGSAPVTVSGGAGLTVKDSNPTKEHAFSVGATGLWTLDENGTNTVCGGCITGGLREVGGGILNGGVLVLEGGNVVGNRARVSGGGIANVDGATSFVLKGGSVTGNVADYAGGVSFEPVDGTFEMTGGVIASNVALGALLDEYDVSEIAPSVVPSVVTNSYGGGGVFNAGTFLMSGGTIRDNVATSSNGGGVCNGKTGRFYLSGGKELDDPNLALIDGCKAYNGGGIANFAALHISGGRISNCEAQNLGGGIYTRTFGMDNGMDMVDGVIKDCSAFGEAGDGIASDGGTVEISGNSEISLTFSGFNSGVGVFSSGGTLAVRGGKIQISPASGIGSVSPGELDHVVAAVFIKDSLTIIDGGTVKSEYTYGDAIWAEMYDSKFTLTGDAQVYGHINLKVVSSDKIEISGGKLDGSITATDKDGNKQKGFITDLDSDSTDQDPEQYAEKHPVTDTSVAAVVPAGSTTSNGYDKVTDAFNNLTEGSRLVLLKSDVSNANITVRFAVTAELNGHDFDGRVRCSRQFNIVSGPNGGGETVVLGEYTSNNSSYNSYADVYWGTDGKPMTIVADRISVPHGNLVLADSTDVTINSTPGGYAGIAKFVLNQSLAEGGSVTNSAKLTLRGGLYGSDMAWLKNPVTGALTEVSLTNYVAEGYVLRDNLDWTFSVIPRPVKVETPDVNTDGVISEETDEGTAAADETVVKAAAAKAIGEIAGNEAAANFKDTNVETTIQDSETGETTSDTVKLLQQAAVTQVTKDNVEAATNEIAVAKDIKSYINVKLTNTTMRTYTVASESTTKTVCSAVVYDVKPIVTVKVMDGDEEKEVTAVIPNEQIKEMGAKIVFRLPVPSSFEKTVKVYHEGDLFGIYPVQTEYMSDGVPYRFVEIESDEFSAWKVETSDFVACIGTTGYKTLAAAFAGAQANDKIEILCDFAAAGVATNKCAVTLDLRGCTVSGTDTLVYNESDLTVVGNGKLVVTGAGELYAIRTVSEGAASVTVSSGTVDGVYTDGADISVNLAGAKLDRACKCLAAGTAIGKITNGSFKSDVTLATDAARETIPYVAETHYMSYSQKNGYRDVVKNKIRANWVDPNNGPQVRYYATFQDAITACYSIQGLTLTLCEDVSENVAMPTDRVGDVAIVTDGHTFNASKVTPADGYKIYATATGYEYRLSDPVAVVISADGLTTNGYPSVKRAFAAATNNTTVRLLENVTSDTIGVEEDLSVTLDLNGKTLAGKVESGWEEIPAARAAIVNKGNLTIVDSSGTDAGCVYNASTGSAGTGFINPAVYNYSAGTLTIEGGTIGTSGANYGEAVYNDGTAYIRGGRFTNYSSTKCSVFLNNAGATMDVTGGTVFGTTDGWFVNSGDLTVGGAFETTGYTARYGIMGAGSSTTTVTGGTFRLAHASSGFVPSVFIVSSTVDVSGGTFEGEASYPEGFEWRLYNDAYGMPVLTGGTYPRDVDEATAPYYYSHDNQNGTWTVLSWKAEYDALDDVFPDSAVITIDKDGKITVTLTEGIGALELTDALPSFELDLNTYSISGFGTDGGHSAIVVSHDENVTDEKSIVLVGPGFVKGGDGNAEAIEIADGAKMSVDSSDEGVVILKGIPNYAFAAVPFAITRIWLEDETVFISFDPDFVAGKVDVDDVSKWGYMGAYTGGIKVRAFATLEGETSDHEVRFVNATAEEVTIAIPKTSGKTAEFYKLVLKDYP